MKDGGPAYPIPMVEADKDSLAVGGRGGMTMRQWYKGMAMQGMMANPEHGEFLHGHKSRADICAVAADAMIEEDERHDQD